MKLTTFTDYGLRTLMYLAAQPERRATIAQIAAAFDISANHLTKVVHFLGQCGWLANVRGKGGGLSLAVAADAICVGDVVRRTEGVDLPAECFGEGGGHCPITPVCRLQKALAEAVEAFYAALDRYTLADIARNQRALAGILFVDRPARTTA